MNQYACAQRLTSWAQLHRLLAGLITLAIALVSQASAAPVLSITPITWNVIGLDSNNPGSSGPDTFPVGARVCNVGDAPATGVTAQFTWTGTNANINSLGLTQVTLSDLPAGSAPAHFNTLTRVPANCQDAYFNVVITRTSAAYNTTRSYSITASGTGLTSVSTPTRALFVEKLVSQNRNAVTSFKTVTPVTTYSVGQVLQFQLDAKTATGGYEQLENFPVLPNSVYQVLDVRTTYSSPTGGINSSVYADACGWDDVPTSPTYRSCIGPTRYAGGKAGGTMTSIYTVRIISGGSSGVYNLIYDFSGSSYHYNSDYGNSANGFVVNAVAPDVTLSKTHSGNFTVGVPASFTFTVSTANADLYGTTTVTDTLPAGLSLPDGPVTVGGANASRWSCTAASNTVTCTSTNVDTPRQPNTPLLTAGSSSTFTISGITVGAAAVPSVSNTAAVSNPNEDPTKKNNNTSTDTVTVSAAPTTADLSITKTGPSTAVAGTAISYTLTLSNAGPSPAAGTTFSDPAPAVLTGVTAACQNATGGVTGCVVTVGTNNAITGTVGTLPSGGSVQILITGTVPAAATGTLINQATVSTPTGVTDPSTTNNTSAAVTTTLTRTSDLAVDASAAAAVGSGGAVTYTIRVWNNGPSVTSAASVPVTLPTGFTVTGLTCAPTGAGTCGTQNFTASTVSITTGSLTLDSTPGNTAPDGNFVTYTLTGTAPVSGNLSLAASVTAPSGVTDSVTTNNTGASVTRVIDAVNDASTNFTPGAGGTVTVLGNDTVGGAAATPANSTVTISNDGGLTGLTVNASGQLVVPATTPNGSYAVTYTLCDKTLITACDAATAGVTVGAATPNLAISVSGPGNARPSTVASTNPPVTASDSFVAYTLTVSTTAANATGTTTVTTTLPSGLSWTGAFTAGPGIWTCAASGQVITCTTTSNIAVGTGQTITLQNVKVAPGTAAGATFTTTATVSNPAETPADAATGNSASATTKLIYTTVTKEVRNVTLDTRDNGGAARFAATSSGLPGDVLEYCFNTQNLGGADLLKYTLRDMLNVLSMPVLSVTADPAYANNAIKWTRVTPGTPAVTTTGSYTASSGDDAGTLSSTLTVNLGTLLAGETVRTCIQTTIR